MDNARAFIIVLFDLFGAPLLCPCRHNDREHATRVMQSNVADGFSSGHRAVVEAGRVLPVPADAAWEDVAAFAAAQKRDPFTGALSWTAWRTASKLDRDDVVQLRLPRHRSLDGRRARVLIHRRDGHVDVQPFGGGRMITVKRTSCERVAL